MGKKEAAEKEAKEKKEAAEGKEALEGLEAEAGAEAGADDGEHDDAAADKELIKKMIAEYIGDGKDGEMDESEAMEMEALAKEAYEAHKEMGASEKEAYERAGHALKLAKLAEAKENGIESVKVVRKIKSAVSCDLVTEAGAGGKILNFIEGGNHNGKKRSR